MNETKFQAFSEAYRQCLREAVEAHPEKYVLPRDVPRPEAVDKHAERILSAMRANPRGVNYLGSDGFKRTCKALGIKYTVTSIFEYLEIVS